MDEASPLKRVTRPWGWYECILPSLSDYQVKRLSIAPGNCTSLQSHEKRSEHWHVVSGQGIANVDEASINIKPGDSVGIKVGEKHRIINNGLTDLIIIEVQRGEYLGEDDIVRYHDIYGRVLSE